jgi:hypothetical protein
VYMCFKLYHTEHKCWISHSEMWHSSGAFWCGPLVVYVRSSNNNRDSYESVYSVELSGSRYGAEQSAAYVFTSRLCKAWTIHSHVNAEVSVWVSHSFSYVSCYITTFIFTKYLQVALLTLACIWTCKTCKR